MSFREDIKRPFNQLNLALAILGLGVGFYFYFFPRNDKGIAFTAEPPSLIYDSKLSSPALRLLDSKNSAVTSDTYLQTFTFWNTGSTPIEPSDVRRPVTLVFQGAERILDAKIVSATDPEVAGFSVSNTNVAGMEITNAAELKWKHFDPKKAVKVQVIFAQQTKPASFVSSDIVGVSKLQAGVKEKKWYLIAATVLTIGFWAYQSISLLKIGFQSKSGLKWIPISFGGVVAVALIVFTSIWVSKTLLPTPPL